eukprot:PITA_27738
MDVKVAFLNGKIEEEVYNEHPEGFETFNRESHVCKLKTALYGLNQAPHAWYTRINGYFKGDDQLIQSCKEDLAREFEMKDMGLMHYFLGMELSQAMVQPTKLFWKVAKHVLRYLRGTSQFGLWYRWTEGVKLQGFIDADWAGSTSDQKSTSGGIFNLGSAAVS